MGERCPDWYVNAYLPSKYCHFAVRPWEWAGAPASPPPFGWQERMLVAGAAERNAELAASVSRTTASA